MRKLLLLNALAFLIVTGHAQDADAIKGLNTASADTVEGWKKGVNIFINFSQTSLTNWSAGGQSSFAGSGLVNMFANYKKGNTNWDNTLDIGLGALKQNGDDGFVKTDDKIDLASKYGYKAFTKWNYAALFNFKTQLLNGYNYPNDSVIISSFMSPAYILTAAGLDYKPGPAFSAFIAPVTAKYTIVNDQVLADSGAFGVDPGKKFRGEFGGYLRVQFQKDIFKNVNFGTKAEFFSNYLNNPQNIDVNWETLLTLKANEFLSATVSTQLIYDDDINIAKDDDDDGVIDRSSPDVQFKEVLAIGITLKF